MAMTDNTTSRGSKRLDCSNFTQSSNAEMARAHTIFSNYQTGLAARCDPTRAKLGAAPESLRFSRTNGMNFTSVALVASARLCVAQRAHRGPRAEDLT
jgi:hypothetical protein